MAIPKKVNIAEFKAHMGVYLKRVKEGEEVILKDRNLEVARISPISNATPFSLEILPAKRSVKEFDDFIPVKVDLGGLDSLQLLKESREEKK
jgi:hypothetical protein